MPLPPAILASLHVFDAVARLGSFSAAGEALNITQSAVSHRIKQLEASLNVTLFRRTTRNLELTREGTRIASATRCALSEVEAALHDLNQEKQEGMIILSVLSSFASKWLVPHLVDFYMENPGSQVSVLSQDELADFRRDPIDAGLRYTRSPPGGLHATHLSRDWLVPIASPRLFRGGKIPKTPAEMTEYPLMAYRASLPFDIGCSWSYWFREMGSDIRPEPVGPQYDRADMMIESAIAGHNIVLGRAMLLEQDLFESGALVQVGPKVPAQADYYFLTLPEKADWPKIVTFRTWLKKSMDETYSTISDVLY